MEQACVRLLLVPFNTEVDESNNSPFLFLSIDHCPPSLKFLFPGVFNIWRHDQDDFAKHTHIHIHIHITHTALKTLGFPKSKEVGVSFHTFCSFKEIINI